MHPIRPRHASALAVFLAALVLGISTAEAGRSIQKDLVYSTIQGKKLRLDIRYPATPPPKDGYPVIISIHGGGWVMGDRHKDLFLKGLTAYGYAFVSIDYRLSEKAKYPAQIEDVRAALAWLLERSSEYRLNPHRIGVTGTSAGGQLALLLGFLPQKPPHIIRAICALYPPTDLVAIIPRDKRNRDDNVVARLLGGPVADQLTLARAASPVNCVGRDVPPVLLIHGDRDHLVPISQSQTLNTALRKVGGKSQLIVCEGMGHGFSLRADTIREVAKFFDRYLKD